MKNNPFKKPINNSVSKVIPLFKNVGSPPETSAHFQEIMLEQKLEIADSAAHEYFDRFFQFFSAVGFNMLEREGNLLGEVLKSIILRNYNIPHPLQNFAIQYFRKQSEITEPQVEKKLETEPEKA